MNFGNIFLPEEFLIIGTALCLRKDVVSIEEIGNYIKRKKFNIEYDEEPFKYCVFNEEEKTYTVNIPQLPPQIIAVLTNL